MNSDDWKPREGRDPDGRALWCSPACGGGCTWIAHDRAWHEAYSLARYMGEGWAPRVWESLGWYYEIQLGPVRIWPSCVGSRKDGYWVVAGWNATMNTTAGSFIGEGESPSDAYDAMMLQARDRLSVLAAAIEEAGG